MVSPSHPTFVHPSGVVVGDFDGDGRDDLLVAASGLDRHPFPGEPNGLMVGGGAGLMDVGDRLPVRDGFTHSGAAGDVDCDGDLDLYVGNIGNAPADLLLNDGSGRFSVASGVIPGVWRDEPEDFDGGDTDALDIEMGDLDGDGFPELLLGMVSRDGSVGTVVLWNNGTGDYSNAVESVFPAPAGFPLNSQVKVVDIDGDGDQDVVAAFAELDHQGFALQILRNDGGRTLTETTGATSPTSAWIQEMFPVDLDNDGDVDFSMFSFPERFLVNDGSGSFTPRGLGFLGLGQSLCVNYLIPIDADGDGLTEFIGQGEWKGPGGPPPGHYHCLFRK